MRTFVVTLVLLFGGQLQTAHADTFALSEGFVVLGHSYDLASSQRAFGANTGVQAHKWLARFDSPLAFTTAKIPIALLQLWVVRKLHDTHPKLATGINLATGAFFTGLGARNQRLTYMRPR